MGLRNKQTFPQRRHIDNKQTHEKKLNITHYQRNANQNHNVVSSHASEWPPSKNLQAKSAREGVENREPSYPVGGNAN